MMVLFNIRFTSGKNMQRLSKLKCYGKSCKLELKSSFFFFRKTSYLVSFLLTRVSFFFFTKKHRKPEECEY